MKNTTTTLSARLSILALLGLTIFYTAWVCDDAFITFRSIENFIAGYGLRWNIVERAQSFTHPLWAFCILIVRLISGECYYSTLALSLVCVLIAVFILLRNIKQSELFLVVTVALIGSRAFIDFSTSGLENPLLYLLLALAFTYSLNPKVEISKLTLIAALILIARQDAILIFLPIFITVLLQARFWTQLPRVFLGMLPFIVWELFSIIYYGAFFPNTAYAKLATGISRGELFAQGGEYLFESMSHDCLTWVIILLGLLPIFSKQPKLKLWSAGVLLHLLYVVVIGGDFMSGRFFANSFFAALLIITKLESRSFQSTAFVSAILLAMAAINPRTPWRTGPNYTFDDRVYFEARGVIDDRALFYQGFGLLPVLSRNGELRDKMLPLAEYLKDSKQAVWVENGIGFLGYFAGPHVTVIDTYALSDPFLARLPIRRDISWSVGHYRRFVDADYLDSLTNLENRIIEPTLRECLNHIWQISRAEIWSTERLNSILKLNWQGCVLSERAKEDLLQPSKTVVKLTPPYNISSQVDFDGRGVDILFEPPASASLIKVSLPKLQGIVGEYHSITEQKAGFTILAEVPGPELSRTETINVSPRFIDQKITKLTILPVQGSGKYTLENVSLLN